MATTGNVGQKVEMAIEYLDKDGKLMPAPNVDAIPTWSNTASSVETLAPAADGQSCVGSLSSPGSDTVTVSVVVGGQTFTATLDVTVDAAPQVLGSIQITANATG